MVHPRSGRRSDYGLPRCPPPPFGFGGGGIWLCGIPAACKMAAPFDGLRYMISRLRRWMALSRCVASEMLCAQPSAAAGSDPPNENASELAAASRMEPGERPLIQLAAADMSS